MKKIKVLALVMVFAFAALGGAYAWWSDTLYVNETVKTGTVDVQWETLTPASSDQDNEMNPGGVDNWYSEGSQSSFTKKNVSSIDVQTDTVSPDSDTAAFSNVNDNLVITIEHAYPGLNEIVYAKIRNHGTIPVKLNNPVRDSASDTAPWIQCLFSVKSSGADLNTVVLDPYGSANDSVDVKITESINPFGDYAGSMNQGLGYEGGGLAGHITFNITADQWNKYI